MSVSVCVATYRRPGSLAGLISLLRPQLEAMGAALVVVDNDPDQSAQQVVAAAIEGGVKARYVTEPRPGIPMARNAALAAADSELVVFTDDDVRPSPGWLEALVARHRETAADVVTGPVRFVFPDGPPRWVGGAHCFQERRPDAADASNWAITSNVLFRAAALVDRGLTFNEGYGLAGGSDTELFRRLGRAGATFAWAPEALVEELVEGDRATIRWAVRRSYRIGNTSVLVDRETSGWSWRRWLADIGRWMLWALKSLTAGVVRGDVTRLVRALSSASRAVGIMSGIANRRYEEYARRG